MIYIIGQIGELKRVHFTKNQLESEIQTYDILQISHFLENIKVTNFFKLCVIYDAIFRLSFRIKSFQGGETIIFLLGTRKGLELTVALQRKQVVNNYIHTYSSLLKIDRLISIAVIQILRRALSIMAANEDSR